MSNHLTPASAALATFPARSDAQVVAQRTRGVTAVVLVRTGPEPYPHLEAVLCEHGDDGWREGDSGNGPGWTRVGQSDDSGALAFWQDVDADVQAVRIAFRNEIRDVTTENGVFLEVWWEEAAPGVEWPSVVAVKRGGIWRST